VASRFGLKPAKAKDLIEVQTDRGGLAPQILVGFFFKGPQKKKKNCCQNKIAEQKKKGH
jgi:hypothetical protein